ncbi:MAG: sugar ABC transporter ATP-binding protein [Armatimonadota bacterium]|nr:sugar ABC transporter ATP-binding protein [Armatimonadota bacterium]MDR7451531.1 sugar ABC transporter ATP-binding protein [Armatimonadota bacterium]MDR7467498.1 sugar ABC transporter ATP-binding protein [Armatimonadota bacterium]MDR7494372.1 sugar ABC transporter ATP-binding protein [Armatimonadota bacterium]MDR7499189.1 sugar ABC transporter ATP-binding protein [Armatimonadota bacterium]
MQPPVLEVAGVSKTFDTVVCALENVGLAVRPREIVGVVGENGAGKSTLMKILVGAYAPDTGELWYRGSRVPFPRNPTEAARRGISIVYQEKGVIPLLPVYQFLLLGQEDRYTALTGLRLEAMKRQAQAMLDELHVPCTAEDVMYELPASTQKMVEIARAMLSVRLACNDLTVPPVIILDEPTAPLTLEERRELFRDLLAMKSTASFIFVSHVIPEVMEFADRVYVLRDGRLVAHFDLSEEKITEEELFRAIVGREAAEFAPAWGARRVVDEAVVLAAEGLTKRGAYYDVSFALRRGECLGLFGPAGSGKSEIVATIAGLSPFDAGSLTIKGRRVRADEPPHLRLARGVGYFSGETGKELFLNWPVAQNISILNIARIVGKRLPVIRLQAERAMAERVVRKLRIRTPSVNTDCYSLSGGSKQKVSVGKWLERSPEILLLEDPTIGIDVGARADIYEIFGEMKRQGTAMLLVSDDPKEYATLCDTILLIRDGRVQRALTPGEFAEMTTLRRPPAGGH